MGEVAIIYKVMPDGLEVDLESLKKSIHASLPAEAKINKIDERPVAFGLKALEVQIILDDRKGGSDLVEEILGGLDGVQSVDILQMGLL